MEKTNRPTEPTAWSLIQVRSFIIANGTTTGIASRQWNLPFDRAIWGNRSRRGDPISERSIGWGRRRYSCRRKYRAYGRFMGQWGVLPLLRSQAVKVLESSVTSPKLVSQYWDKLNKLGDFLEASLFLVPGQRNKRRGSALYCPLTRQSASHWLRWRAESTRTSHACFKVTQKFLGDLFDRGLINFGVFN